MGCFLYFVCSFVNIKVKFLIDFDAPDEWVGLSVCYWAAEGVLIIGFHLDSHTAIQSHSLEVNNLSIYQICPETVHVLTFEPILSHK